MIRLAIFSFMLGVIFNGDVHDFAARQSANVAGELRAALSVDAYGKIVMALK
jgi:hypothetical protein